MSKILLSERDTQFLQAFDPSSSDVSLKSSFFSSGMRTVGSVEIRPVFREIVALGSFRPHMNA